MLDVAQLITDVCNHYQTSMQQSDNPAVRKNAKKHCDLLMKFAKKILGEAEKLHSELQSGDYGVEDEPSGIVDDESEHGEPDGDEMESEDKDEDEGKEEVEVKAEKNEPDDDEEIDMDETGRLKPKSFPNINTYRLEPMNQSDFRELVTAISKKSRKSNTETELKEAKQRIADLEKENEKAKSIIVKFQELKELGRL
jgi:hypothetical protein